jgi:hypothetical protein
MVDLSDPPSAIAASGIGVSLDSQLRVASLRYFDFAGEFADAVTSVIGTRLPETRCATIVSHGANAGAVIMAWRRPTETLLLCEDLSPLQQLRSIVDDTSYGCVIDQTGGEWPLRVTGEGAEQLFSRIAGEGAVPLLGESRRSRLAEVPVLALQVQAGEYIFVVDRVYGEHLMAWIRVVAADIKIR